MFWNVRGILLIGINMLFCMPLFTCDAFLVQALCAGEYSGEGPSACIAWKAACDARQDAIFERQ